MATALAGQRWQRMGGQGKGNGIDSNRWDARHAGACSCRRLSSEQEWHEMARQETH